MANTPRQPNRPTPAPILRPSSSTGSPRSNPQQSPPRPPHRNDGGRRDGGGGNGGNDGNHLPSPWLNAQEAPNPVKTASFVEYLRWMRPADHPYKDATKVQILQMTMENAKYYDDRLKICHKRTRAIAKDSFEVSCPWRIRVGGHRGPESILLPAFDALGMPYIPSATLRGVARNQAIREVMKNTGKDWKSAEKDPLIVKHFGSLEADKQEQAGKVVFFDAYPSSGQCLAMDMANNIWSWDGNSPKYSPNPNPFLSLKEPTFLIGLGLISGCQDQSLLEQVKKWLMAGLANGAGSQVNTGYGQLLENPKKLLSKPFLEVEFSLEGQLIHGYQKFLNVNQPYKTNRDGSLKIDRNGNLQANGIAEAEVRPTAFKSMLRYWFRVFALGVLPAQDVQQWEGKIFGAISPIQNHGLLRVNVFKGRVTRKESRNKNDDPGEMVGTVTLSFSPEFDPGNSELSVLLQNLTWLMFNLGGVGQGARRPCYSRSNRQYAPWWRGSTLFIESDPWNDPEEISAKEFASLFKRRLQKFYDALGAISGQTICLRTVGSVDERTWQDVADENCRILITSGQDGFGKPYALAQLHSDKFKVERRGELNYNGNLCGQVLGDVKPSPVWVANAGEDFQVVTIFGATASPRLDYLRSLKGAISVFPLT